MDKFVTRHNGNEEMTASKRIKLEDAEAPHGDSDKPISKIPEICPYGEKCYRKNIHHFREYRHLHLEELLRKESAGRLNLPENVDQELLQLQIEAQKKFGYKPDQSTSEGIEDRVNAGKLPVKNEVKSGGSESQTVQADIQKEVISVGKKNSELSPLEKWEMSKPFNIFLTSIGPEKTYFSMSLIDLFHSAFGKVKRVCHINFMIEHEWLMDQIVSSDLWGKPLTIVYGTENPGIELITKDQEWITSFRAKSPHTFGHHHTKMSLVEYEDGCVRFIVYTANFIESDWMNKTQGMWVSPKCPPVAPGLEKNSGESPTGFRKDMLAYLSTYHVMHLESWIKLIRTTDCSQIKVVFVASAPNLAQSLGTNGFQWGIKKVDQVLQKHQTAEVNSQWPIIAQCSSIGSMGTEDSWLRSEWGHLMEGPRKTRPPIKLVYPSVADVRSSADGEDGADCLPYGNMTHCKQKWLERYMCKWVGFTYNRTYALPHVKTYCRVSPDNKQMAWFILTSANLSKAAWGKLNKNKDQLTVMSWECGVLLLPKFLTGESAFEGTTKVVNNGSRASSRVAAERGTVVYDFPIPYDLPVTPYTGVNKPWLVDYLGHPRRQPPAK